MLYAKRFVLSALVSAASLTSISAFADSPQATHTAPASGVSRSAPAAQPKMTTSTSPRLNRMTQGQRLVGRGTSARLAAVASEKQGDTAAATKQHARAAGRYEKAVQKFAAAGAKGDAAYYASHAASEYKLAGDAQGAARMERAAETHGAAALTVVREAPSTPAPARPTDLTRLTQGNRFAGEGTAARLRAADLASSGRRGDAAAEHDRAAGYYEQAATEFKAAGDPEQAAAYTSYAKLERQAAAQVRAPSSAAPTSGH